MTFTARLLALSLPSFALLAAESVALAGSASPHAEIVPHTVALLEAGQPLRIVCFGDSITGVYYHTGSRRAWCDMLGIALKRIYPHASLEMINAGVSGNNTVEALARMDHDVIKQNPQLVVVMFGMNDLLAVSPAAFHDNLAEMVRRIRAQGAEAILMTPNIIYADDPRRSPSRLAEYASIVRVTGRELTVPVVDAFQVFQSIEAADHRAWTRHMSDTLHPNMRGHKVFAEEVAYAISGKRVSLADVTPAQPELPHVAERLRSHATIRVVAMKPYDALIGPALKQIDPTAEVEVTSWDPKRDSLATIEAQAKDLGWWKYHNQPTLEKPDLILLAVPADAAARDDEDFHRLYSWVINWSCSYSSGGWDCIAILPSCAEDALSPTQRILEEDALDVIHGTDVPWIERAAGDETPALGLLTRRLRAMLDPAKP